MNILIQTNKGERLVILRNCDTCQLSRFFNSDSNLTARQAAKKITNEFNTEISPFTVRRELKK